MRGFSLRVAIMVIGFHRDSCVAVLLRRAPGGAMAFAAGLTIALVSSPAIAEVCDKVAGETWYPRHGPVWLLNLSHPPVAAWVFIASAIAAIVLLRRRWIGYVAAVLFAMSAVVTLVGLDPDDIVQSAAQKEGCVSILTNRLDASIWTVLAVTSVILAHAVARKRITS